VARKKRKKKNRPAVFGGTSVRTKYRVEKQENGSRVGASLVAKKKGKKNGKKGFVLQKPRGERQKPR